MTLPVPTTAQEHNHRATRWALRTLADDATPPLSELDRLVLLVAAVHADHSLASENGYDATTLADLGEILTQNAGDPARIIRAAELLATFGLLARAGSTLVTQSVAYRIPEVAFAEPQEATA